LLSGSTGTGKSTLGMSIALHHHILKCISTDTIRQVLRSVYPKNTPSSDGNRSSLKVTTPIENTLLAALHRSSYASKPADITLPSSPDNPIENWLECCSVLNDSIVNLISDAIKRHESLILEGVHIIPSNTILDEWKRSGGSALGILLVISDPKVHQEVLFQRGKLKQSSEKAKDQLQSFLRIRQIQEKMIQLAQENKWLIIEQKIH
jgi:2-phosphoglycerate kinase